MPGRSRKGKSLFWAEVLVCRPRVNPVCGSAVQPETTLSLNHRLCDQQLMFPSGTHPSESPGVKYLLNITEQPQGFITVCYNPSTVLMSSTEPLKSTTTKLL